MTLKCPECGSDRLVQYSNNWIDCCDCGHMGRTQDFGAKCNCAQPHHLPVWRCPVHGDVAVDAG